MNICFISYYGNPQGGDMGTKGTANYLANEMALRHAVLRIPIDRPLSWRMIDAFKPDVLHFVLGPASIFSFFAIRALALRFPRAKTVLSATLPLLSWRPLIRTLRPNLVLVQSAYAEQEFRALGCCTAFLPNGVDTAKFAPASAETKAQLRRNLSIEAEKSVVLYAGSLIQRRNILLLGKLVSPDTRVVLAGRAPRDEEACRELEAKGCTVWQGHFENMPEIYAMADCYVFPVPPENRAVCVETPLSVLEAMSCNLHVISTRFGALPRLFSGGGGFFYADDDDAFQQHLATVKQCGQPSQTRKNVLQYSWTRIGERLNSLYNEKLS